MSPRPVAFLPFPLGTTEHHCTEVPQSPGDSPTELPKQLRVRPTRTNPRHAEASRSPCTAPAGLRTDEAPVQHAPKHALDPHVIGSGPSAEANTPHGTTGLPQQPKPLAPCRLPGGTPHTASDTPRDASTAPIIHPAHREANFPPTGPGPSHTNTRHVGARPLDLAISCVGTRTRSCPGSSGRGGCPSHPSAPHQRRGRLQGLPPQMSPYPARSVARTTRAYPSWASIPLQGASPLPLRPSLPGCGPRCATQHNKCVERPRPWDGLQTANRPKLVTPASLQWLGGSCDPGSHRCERRRLPKLPKPPPPESVRG